MDVNAKTSVVGQVITDVIGIVVDNYVVTVPIPAIAIGNVRSGHREIKVAEVEAVRSAARQMPNVAGAETTSEMAMFPRMIQVIARIVLAGVVTDPLVSVYVGSIRMSRVFVEMLRRTLSGSRLRIASRRRSASGSFARRKVPLSSSFMPLFLGKPSHRKRRH